MTTVDTWRALRLNVDGMENICCCFGIAPAVYREFYNRFQAAELAWLVAGASHDGAHLQLRSC